MSKINTAAKSSTNTIDFADYRSTAELTKLRKSAFTQYEVGRKAIYSALAATFIWYELSKDNSDYINQAFKSFKKQTNTHHYAQALKVCLKLDAVTQAPTLSKYKSVLVFLKKQLGNQIITDGSDATIKMVTGFIVHEGSLDACVNSLREKSSSKTGLTLTQLKSRISAYRSNKKKKTITKFSTNKPLTETKSKLVVMLGRFNGSDVEVVDVFANDSLVELVVRRK